MRLFGWRSREMLGRYGASAAEDGPEMPPAASRSGTSSELTVQPCNRAGRAIVLACDRPQMIKR